MGAVLDPGEPPAQTERPLFRVVDDLSVGGPDEGVRPETPPDRHEGGYGQQAGHATARSSSWDCTPTHFRAPLSEPAPPLDQANRAAVSSDPVYLVNENPASAGHIFIAHPRS